MKTERVYFGDNVYRDEPMTFDEAPREREEDWTVEDERRYQALDKRRRAYDARRGRDSRAPDRGGPILDRAAVDSKMGFDSARWQSIFCPDASTERKPDLSDFRTIFGSAH